LPSEKSDVKEESNFSYLLEKYAHDIQGKTNDGYVCTLSKNEVQVGSEEWKSKKRKRGKELSDMKKKQKLDELIARSKAIIQLPISE
jgi:hypothetical protein